MESTDKKNASQNQQKSKNFKKGSYRNPNEFNIHYILSPEKIRKEKYEKELKMSQRKKEISEKRKGEIREEIELSTIHGMNLEYPYLDNNDHIIKRREEPKPVFNIDEERIKLFGEHFVQMNKLKCKLVIEGKEIDLCEYYTTNSKEKTFQIKFKSLLIL